MYTSIQTPLDKCMIGWDSMYIQQEKGILVIRAV